MSVVHPDFMKQISERYEEMKSEVARLKRRMARAADHARGLQPDTMAGVVVSLLESESGGPDPRDATIKALADALRNMRAVAASQGISELHETILNADDALRLAGRL